MAEVARFCPRPMRWLSLLRSARCLDDLVSSLGVLTILPANAETGKTGLLPLVDFDTVKDSNLAASA